MMFIFHALSTQLRLCNATEMTLFISTDQLYDAARGGFDRLGVAVVTIRTPINTKSKELT
jgi:hypothetical protein